MIRLFDQVGLDDVQLNIKAMALINYISNEETCCIRIIESGVLTYMVSVYETFNGDHVGAAAGKGTGSSSRRQRPTLIDSKIGGHSGDSTSNSGVERFGDWIYTVDIELGMHLCAGSNCYHKNNS